VEQEQFYLDQPQEALQVLALAVAVEVDLVIILSQTLIQHLADKEQHLVEVAVEEEYQTLILLV
jgi:hypothetical protein